MPLAASFHNRLRLPAIVAPMFLISGPDLVVETCAGGLVGTFPALNQRSTQGLRDWIQQIRARLAHLPDAAPFGVNLVAHKTNPRLEADLQVCIDEKVPLIITSLGAVSGLVAQVQAYGGAVFHDAISARHARKAAEAGVDGIIAVAAGAGGHAGSISPFALLSEIRTFFDGTLVLAGAINTGRDIAAAQMMGADMAYLGTRFIATQEAMAAPDYKQMLVDSGASDVILTPRVSGVNANFLRPSLLAAGLDPDNLPEPGALDVHAEARVWRDLWSAGQGVGAICDVPPARALCDRLVGEHAAAVSGFCAANRG